MTRAQVISDFPLVSIQLQKILEELKNELSLYTQESGERFKEFKENFNATWLRWNETALNYKKSIEGFPKELKTRDIIQEIKLELDNFESEAKRYFGELKELSYQDFKESFASKISELQNRFKEMQSELAALENHPLMQKFLRGEPILSSAQQIQWGRKIGHAAFAVLFTYLFIFSKLNPTLLWSLTGIFFLWAYSLEISRHFVPRINDWVCKYFKHVMRESEKEKINSAMYYMTAMLAVYLLCPVEVSMLTMLFLGLGDPVAGVIGVKFGKHKLWKGASWEGSIAGFLTCFAVSLLSLKFAFFPHASWALLSLCSCCCAFFGALSESLPHKLDDNLVIPLISAPSVWIILNSFLSL